MIRNNHNPFVEEQKKQKRREINKSKRKQKEQRHQHYTDDKNNFSRVNKEWKDIDSRSFGPKSVFFDPEFNPQGIAPPGFKNYYYPLRHPEAYIVSEDVACIPLPADPVPKYFKFYSKAGESLKSYEGEENINISTGTSMVPTALLRKKKRSRESELNTITVSNNKKKVRLETVDDQLM